MRAGTKHTIQSGRGIPFWEDGDISGALSAEKGLLCSYTKACGKRTLAP